MSLLILHPMLGGILSDIENALSFASDPLGFIAHQIGQGVTDVTQAFGHVFTSVGLDFGSVLGAGGQPAKAFPHIHVPLFDIVLWLSLAVALFALVVQTVRTVVSGSGEHLAQALLGLVRTAIVIAASLGVTLLLINGADELSNLIITKSAGTTQVFGTRLGEIAVLDPGLGTVLAIVLGLLAIVSVIILLIEMIARNVAIVILVLTLPLAATGSMFFEGRSWWPKARNWLITAIFLKPVIALLFAIAFLIAGGNGGSDSGSIEATVTGLMALVVAALAWPILARFLSFTEAGGGAGAGGAFFGALSGSALTSRFAGAGGGGGGSPAGAGASGSSGTGSSGPGEGSPLSTAATMEATSQRARGGAEAVTAGRGAGVASGSATGACGAGGAADGATAGTGWAGLGLAVAEAGVAGAHASTVGAMGAMAGHLGEEHYTPPPPMLGAGRFATASGPAPVASERAGPTASDPGPDTGGAADAAPTWEPTAAPTEEVPVQAQEAERTARRAARPIENEEDR